MLTKKPMELIKLIHQDCRKHKCTKILYKQSENEIKIISFTIASNRIKILRNKFNKKKYTLQKLENVERN